MNRYLIFTTFSFVLAVPACAQESTPERVVVPAGKASGQRQININLMNGGVTVKAYAGRDVIVETHGGARSGRGRRRDSGDVEGLKRIELPGSSGLDIEQDGNTVDIRTRFDSGSDLVISVPVESSVKVRCTNGGDIVVDGVHGEVDATNLNGKVTLNGISGTVVAHSMNGAIKASLDRVDATKPISFSTMNGSVDVTLPADLRANFKMKTGNGEVYSDFEVKLDLAHNRPTVENTASDNGKFHMKADSTIYGMVNGGGQEASFTTYNGRISVRKKK